jgi:hypothetical protein
MTITITTIIITITNNNNNNNNTAPFLPASEFGRKQKKRKRLDDVGEERAVAR